VLPTRLRHKWRPALAEGWSPVGRLRSGSRAHIRLKSEAATRLNESEPHNTNRPARFIAVRASPSLWPCSVPRVTQEKDSWAGLVLTSKLKSFDLQQTMKRKFIRALVVVLAAFAVFVFAYPDDLWDDAVYTPSEMLRESSRWISSRFRRSGSVCSTASLPSATKSSWLPQSSDSHPVHK
jgi:hypothetical protein